MKKNKFLLTIALPILLSIISGITIIVLNNSHIMTSRATAMVNKEKSEMTKEISNMISEQKKLTEDISAYNTTLAEKEYATSEIEFLNTELDNYINDINNVNAKISEAEKKISEKTEYLSNITDILAEVQGEKKTLKQGEYKSPSQIKAGRYTAEGNGTIYLYTISNSLRLKENLSLITSHSYTFEINSGETLKIDGTVSLTELIQ